LIDPGATNSPPGRRNLSGKIQQHRLKNPEAQLHFN
jgi:hypothetical protein